MGHFFAVLFGHERSMICIHMDESHIVVQQTSRENREFRDKLPEFLFCLFPEFQFPFLFAAIIINQLDPK